MNITLRRKKRVFFGEKKYIYVGWANFPGFDNMILLFEIIETLRNPRLFVEKYHMCQIKILVGYTKIKSGKPGKLRYNWDCAVERPVVG